MKKLKSLLLTLLAVASLLAFTGCTTSNEITEEEGKAWAEANGYVKEEAPVDSFTSASVKNTGYAGLFKEGQALIDAMGAKKGVTTINTINPDGTVNVAYIRWSLSYDKDQNKFFVNAGVGGTQDDGTLCQTAQNILENGQATMYYISHSWTEQEPVFVAVEGTEAPEFEAGKYYSYSARTNHAPLAEKPEDWDTNFASYFTLEGTNPVNLGAPAETTVATSAQLFCKYVSHEANNWGGNNFVLEVVEFHRAS